MNERNGHDMCKNHTARSEKDLYRVCPSKLSKHELEDLYFALLESNMELKKTVNGQREQIKLLNTKVQRMASQRPTNIREQKECCANNKAIINEQKEVIADLKKSNDRLKERIQLLNMRLCSAKQFLKKGSLPGSARCSKCCGGAVVSGKNSSTNGLNTKATEDSVRSTTTSCQYLAKDTAPVISPMPESSTREQQGGLCDQNKCRTAMEELKYKIMALQQELSQTHEEYSSRIARLEQEMSRLQRENVRVRSESSSSERRLRQRAAEAAELLQRLRKCEGQCEHMTVQLKIERSRFAELEMRAKVAYMSGDIANAIEQHLTNLNNKKEENEKRIEKKASNCNVSDVDNSSVYHCQCQLTVPKNSMSSQTDEMSDISADKMNRASDDSGYTDTNRSCGSLEDSPKKDVQVTNQIAELQAQLDSLKQALGESYENKDDKETFKTIQSRRKSYCQIALPSNNPNETINCSAITPGDADSIRTNCLNSSKSTHELYEEYDKSKVNSIRESRTPVTNSTIKERHNSLFKEDQNDMKTAKKYRQDDVNEMPKLDLSNVHETEEINKTYRKSNSLEYNNKDLTIDNGNKHIDRTSDTCNFSNETVTKVDEKLIHETEHRNESASNIKVDKEFLKIKKMTSVKNIQKDVASTNVGGLKEVAGRKYVSTGVDPINSLPATPIKKLKDLNTFTKVTNPLPLLEKNRLDISEKPVRICTCPVSTRRALAPFRSCSGTLRFTTTAASGQFRRCDCGEHQLTHPPRGQGVEDTPNVRTSTPARGPRVSPDNDNTNCEISSLSDLPSEREVSSARASPGEDRDRPASDELSEGELLGEDRNQQSIGETQSPFDDTDLRRSSPDNMEETLKAVGEEMSRCRRLLRARAEREAVTSPRGDSDKPLALRWRGRFYGQPPALSHLHSSLEYRVPLTRHFLHYLTRKEMAIAVCEADGREPWATCRVPLRDALRHANRRVDMSLALISGCGVKNKNAPNFTVNKELGVLDVWCMLRVPTHKMGVVNDVISQGKRSISTNTLDITILWLALSEECPAMTAPEANRLYVAYRFLGKSGADMETPSSLPKPKNFMDKCHFNFRKSFIINESDVLFVGEMAQLRQDNTTSVDPKDCIVFSIISEPPEDPLGLEACEDIGYAYLYLGDVLSSIGDSHTEVLPIQSSGEALMWGRLAVRVDGLPILRACVERSQF